MAKALVVPGKLSIDPLLMSGAGPAVVVRGPLAGLGQLPDLGSWKQTLWLVRREAARRHGLALREDALDLSGFPRVRRRVAQAALAVVGSGEAARLGRAGEAVIMVAYHRVGGGGGLEVTQDGETRGFSAEDPDLIAAVTGADPEDEEAFEAVWDEADVDAMYDRVLRALSDGALSLRDVDLATWCHGLPDQELDLLDAEIAEVEEDAGPRASLAEAVLAALDAADDDVVDLPELGRARRVRHPPFRIDGNRDTLRLIGGPIEAPAADAWVVEDVEAHLPESRRERLRRAEARWAEAQPRAASGPRWTGALRWLGRLLVVLLVAGAVWAVVRPRDVALPDGVPAPPVALEQEARDLRVDFGARHTVYRYRTDANLLEVSSHYQGALADAGFEVTRSEAVAAPAGPVRRAVLDPGGVRSVAVAGERGGERVEVEADGSPGEVEVRVTWWR